VWTEPTKNGCHGNVPRRIERLISDLSSTVIALPINLARIGPADVDVIGLKVVVKNKKQQQKI